jgi:dihydropyrimidinase
LGASYDLLLRGGTIVSEKAEHQADLAVTDGRVTGVLTRPNDARAAEVVDVTGQFVLPGIVDPHVHFGLANGLAEWESETRSAALGGVTTAFSFLMSGASYRDDIEATLAAAGNDSYIDFGLHLVACAPVHLAEMAQYAARGITSFKYFTSFRGDEGAYLNVAGTDDGFLYEYFEHVARYRNGLACVHAENIEVVWALRARLQEAGRDDLVAWDESRPPSVEAEAALRAILYARELNAALYLVHLSAKLSIDEIRAQKARFPNQQLYAETCPHFLTHHRDMAIGPLGKVNPPLRRESDIEALWEALADGTIDTVGSDHVARRREAKQGSIWKSSAGFPGTAAIVPVLLSEGVHKRALPLTRVVSVASANPARALGLYPTKGSLELGADGDVTVVDLALTRRVAADDVFGGHSDYSLYDGQDMTGWPVLTVVRGQIVMRDGSILGRSGHGRYIARDAALSSSSGGVP